jgi:mannitol-1-phosphate 5-dehydrogenase
MEPGTSELLPTINRARDMKRTYVGFGFGAIQAGLFLYEAFQAKAFRRLVVAEVLPEVVTAIRQANGHFSLNIAHSDRIEQAAVGPIEIANPALKLDRQRLIDAIVEADEVGTAIPSVTHYVSEGPGSLHRILAEGLRKKVTLHGPRAVVYTAENHNHAAEILESKVMAEVPASERQAVRSQVRFLNTVIAKMSGGVADAKEIQTRRLVSITPEGQRAFLVESFNRILISKIRFDQAEGEPPFQRGISVFEEKEELLPFEESKLYGHNAVHALVAYLGVVKGVSRLTELRTVPGMLAFLQAALLDESGQALIRKYQGRDPLFTQQGFCQFADDLLERMLNPYLGDTVERVSRDPARKLGWDDRLIGTMRMALRQGVEPRRFALGAAAALATLPGGGLALDRSTLELNVSAEALLRPLWRQASPPKNEQAMVLDLIEDGRRRLKHWIEAGFQDLESL